VQEVGQALLNACMGCPLLLRLAVSAIRQKAHAQPSANLMAAKWHSCWRKVLEDFQSAIPAVHARGDERADYELVVDKIYEKSICRAMDSFTGQGPTVKGATLQALITLLRALQLVSPGQWIPEAAMLTLWRTLHCDTVSSSCASVCSNETSATAALQLLAEYSIIETRFDDGAHVM
jgi:hypothetical protein